jgi:hypothetical protein
MFRRDLACLRAAARGTCHTANTLQNWCILLLMDYVPLALEQVGCEPQSDPIVPELEGIMISSIKREDAV